MPSELVAATETFTTHCASAFFLWLVNLAVLAEIAALSESASAVRLITNQWLLTRVLGPGMHRELRSLGGFVTTALLAALERFVTSMGTHMRLQRLGRAELVVAEWALACLVASV